MVNLVEQLYRGTLDLSLVNFDLKHFEDRSRQRKLPKSLIKNLIINGKMLNYKKSRGHKNGYKLFYKAPNHLKGYGKITVCVKICDGCIKIMTVYEDKLTSSGNRRHTSKSSNKLTPEEWEEKAYRELRHYW